MKIKPESLRDYDRAVLKSGVSSLFWAVLRDRKKNRGFTLADLARATARDKAAVSRWFATPQNWRLDTVADIADALDVDVEVRAVERGTGRVFTASGPLTQSAYGDGFNVSATAPSPTQFANKQVSGRTADAGMVAVG